MIDADLKDLYQEIILDHGRHPRNHHALSGATHHAHGHNPLCGDTVDVGVADPGGRERLALYILRSREVCWRGSCEVGTVMAQ